MVAVVTILLAAIIGRQLETTDIEPYLQKVMPEAGSFARLSTSTFAAYEEAEQQQIMGYIGFGEADGYGGPMEMAVAVDTAGIIISTIVTRQYETQSYFDRVSERDYFEEFPGNSIQSSFTLGKDIDGVTSATCTSRGIANAVWEASYTIAVNQLGLSASPLPQLRLSIGVPEITILLLFALGFYGHKRKSKYKKQLRWIGMLLGLIVLGFMYNIPVSLSLINKFLMGYWPQWQTGLYWYLMIGGVLFVFTVNTKNPYCDWFCPFGSAQECLGVLGKAKNHRSKLYGDLFIWLRRGITWLAIVVALIFRSPGLTSYEPFSALFDLVGSAPQFILLGIVLLASLFIKRPWCNYLCPVGPVGDFYLMFRKWMIEIWGKNRNPREILRIL
jgi:Na+-translocating ferredoxin:NAD+ oxidoreductase RnfG subunit